MSEDMAWPANRRFTASFAAVFQYVHAIMQIVNRSLLMPRLGGPLVFSCKWPRSENHLIRPLVPNSLVLGRVLQQAPVLSGHVSHCCVFQQWSQALCSGPLEKQP